MQSTRRLHERVASGAARRLGDSGSDSTRRSSALSALEIEDTVTVRDVVAVLQPAELLDRIARGDPGDLVELGEDGRLLRLQLEEVLDGIDPARRLVVRDYLRDDRPPSRRRQARCGRTGASPTARSELALGHVGRPVDRRAARRAPGGGGARAGPWRRRTPTRPVEPRATAFCTDCRGFPKRSWTGSWTHFAGLQRIMRASVGELEEVEGVGEARARSVKEGLARLAEASILDRYN